VRRGQHLVWLGPQRPVAKNENPVPFLSAEKVGELFALPAETPAATRLSSACHAATKSKAAGKSARRTSAELLQTFVVLTRPRGQNHDQDVRHAREAPAPPAW
jgi:hypothetical protein